MITLYIINAVLIGAVSLVALTIMVYWHRVTKAGWKNYPSGRSLMGLLGIIFFITLNAAVQTILPPGIPILARAVFYFTLYLVFIYALVSIGLTIRKEIRAGRAKELHPSTQPHTDKEPIQ